MFGLYLNRVQILALDNDLDQDPLDPQHFSFLDQDKNTLIH